MSTATLQHRPHPPQRRFTDAPQIAKRRRELLPQEVAPRYSARRIWLAVVLSWVVVGVLFAAIRWYALAQHFAR